MREYHRKESPILSVLGMGGSLGGGLAGGGADDLSWFRANVRDSTNYRQYPSGGQIHTVYDNDHVYFIYSLEYFWNGQNGYSEDRAEFWKVKKIDGTTVWHKSYQNVDGAYETFEIFGADLSPDGNYILIGGAFNKEGVPYGQSNNIRYGFAEISTSDGSLRTTANGALYAGGVKDDNANIDERRYGGILYVPGSSTDVIIPGKSGSPAYGGFGRINKGGSSYTASYHVDMYNRSPFNNYVTTDTMVRSMVIEPDNTNLMWLNRTDSYNSDWHNYFLLYNISGSSPTYQCGIRLRGSDFDGRGQFTAKYHASNNIDLYVYIPKSSTYSRITKYNWNGSSWSAVWQNILTVNNGGYGPRNPLTLTYDDDNNRLVVFEGDPPNSFIVRQINTSTGANVTTRRIAIDPGTSTRTSWNLNATNTYGDQIANYHAFKNPCHRAIDGYFYASLAGLDNNNDQYTGHMAFKLPTDISKIPSSVTSYGFNNGVSPSGNGPNIAMSIGISNDDPIGSYQVKTSSFDGTYDNITTHSPDLYGSNSGPMQYYNFVESSCDEWRTGSTASWPSDSQLDLEIS